MIQINNLHFSYSKTKQLFEALELQMQPGKIYGLLGKNGTGKSTLLKLLTGVLFPKTGNITIDGTESMERDPELLSNIFYLSEDYELPSISVKNYVKAYSPFYSRFDEEKFYTILKDFEVDPEARLDRLSFGQKKKTMIAFGIATRAKLLFLDEPTNGLDIPSKSQFRKVLLRGFEEDQIIIISTHQIRDLNHLIESVIIIEDGKIIFNQDVFDIQEKLMFTDATSVDQEDSLYSEMIMGGHIHVMPNTNNESTKVELEVLFNAVIQDSDSFHQIFNV